MVDSLGLGNVCSPSPFTYSGDLLNISPCNVIVIQPGSKYVRIGRASDAEPLTILHAIARKRTLTLNPVTESDVTAKRFQRSSNALVSSLPRYSVNDKLPPEIESARLQLCYTLQASLKPDGSPRYITPNEQISAFNKLCKAEAVTEDIKDCPSDPGHFDHASLSGCQTVIGDDITQIQDDSYDMYFPWKRGDFNTHPGIGGSLTSVLNDLEDIWEWVISTKLAIPLKRRDENYRVIIIIPVMFNRVQAKHLMDLALKQLNFGYVIIVQDHVCATFGAALGTATVVDVGDQRISISCINEGMSLPETRIELKYGGGDLTLAFWNLMSQSELPFKLDLNSLWDVQFLSKMKEDFCHFDLGRCGPEEHNVLWDKPGEAMVRYTVHLGDELLIAPLGFFNPDLLRGSVERSKAISVWKSNDLDIHDDPCDASYIRDFVNIIKSEDDEEGDDDEFMEVVKDVQEQMTRISEGKKIDLDQLLGIDQAILHSIDSCCGDELLKRRFYSCILVVGGGFKFQGLGSWLQNKIALNLPRAFKADTVEVVTLPKDKDPSTVAWKGGALISNLDTTTELWISQNEWNTHGSRILRERSICSF